MPNRLESFFPEIFCLEGVEYAVDDIGRVNCRAALYHDEACVTVSFDATQCGQHLEKAAFVSVRWLQDMHSDHGAIRVAGLTVVNDLSDCADFKNFNPFLAIPHTLDVDRCLIACAGELWEVSTQARRQKLVATIFAQHGRLAFQ